MQQVSILQLFLPKNFYLFQFFTLPYLCGMDEETKQEDQAGIVVMTFAEAWADFWAHIHKAGVWAALAQKEKSALINANKAAQGRHRAALGVKRMQKMFERYTPGRYAIIQAVEFREGE